jgi:hypothetical protein
VAVGDDLPSLPIFLSADMYIRAPLEEAFPADFKELFDPAPIACDFVRIERQSR